MLFWWGFSILVLSRRTWPFSYNNRVVILLCCLQVRSIKRYGIYTWFHLYFHVIQWSLNCSSNLIFFFSAFLCFVTKAKRSKCTLTLEFFVGPTSAPKSGTWRPVKVRTVIGYRKKCWKYKRDFSMVLTSDSPEMVVIFSPVRGSSTAICGKEEGL